LGRRGRHPDPNSKRSQAALARAEQLARVVGRPAPAGPAPVCRPQLDPPARVARLATALGFWQRNAPILEADGRLVADRVDAFAMLCLLQAEIEQLEQVIDGEGWITATDKGQAASPVARLLRDARRDFLTFAREYGLTPAAETRFPPEVEHAEEDAEEAALRAFTG
jgi:P27 family predicted phage terminase small subunit